MLLKALARYWLIASVEIVQQNFELMILSLCLLIFFVVSRYSESISSADLVLLIFKQLH